MEDTGRISFQKWVKFKLVGISRIFVNFPKCIRFFSSWVRISTEVSAWREDNQAPGKMGMSFGYRNKHRFTENREEGVRRMYGKIQREQRTKEEWDKAGN